MNVKRNVYPAKCAELCYEAGLFQITRISPKVGLGSFKNLRASTAQPSITGDLLLPLPTCLRKRTKSFECPTAGPSSAHLVPIKAVMADWNQHEPVLLTIVQLLCEFFLKPRRWRTMSQVPDLEKRQCCRRSSGLRDPVNHPRGELNPRTG